MGRLAGPPRNGLVYLIRPSSGDRSMSVSSSCQGPPLVAPGGAFPGSNGSFVRSSVRFLQEATASWRPVSLEGWSRWSSIADCEKLWRDFFSDPSHWWDNSTGKSNSRFPDFKHKQTGEGLWLLDGQNPAWVAPVIASIAPGFSIASWAQRFPRYNEAGRYERTMFSRWVESEIVSIAPGFSVFSLAQTLSKLNKARQHGKTLELYEQMQREGMTANGHVFVHVLNACTALQALEKGRRIHRQIIQTGCNSNIFVSSCLVNMYSKCGSIDEARLVFGKMPARDVVVWTAMILGCVKCGKGVEALELFQQMQREGVEPDPVTFVGVLNACAKLADLQVGRRVHEQIIRSGCESNIYVGSSLVDMYAKCGNIVDAWKVFDKMPTRNVVVWNSMILGCVKYGQSNKGLELFQKMQREGVEPDPVTFVAVLNACARVSSIKEGRQVHNCVIRSGCEFDTYVGNSLIDMYVKCGSIEDAWEVFDKMPECNVVSWNGMILGYVKYGGGQKALELFHQMKRGRVEPNSLTFVAVLNACARIGALEEGKRIHEQIVLSGCESDVYVGNGLVDMYSKCGNIHDARRIFDNLHTCDVVSWNTMIMGYAMHGLAKEAVALFEQMFRSGSQMDEITFVCLLSACSHGGLVKEGMQCFESMRSVYGVSPTVYHYTCMVDILGRAGRLDDAEDMLNTMPFEPSAAAWISFLGSCRAHGNLDLGERASRCALESYAKSSSAHTLLSRIHAAAGHRDKALVQEQRLKEDADKQPGCTWIEVNGEVHCFTLNDCQHPQIGIIHEEVTRLSQLMKEAGYTPDLKFAPRHVEEGTDAHLGHPSEELAIAFGLLSTPAGSPIRIVKNLRVCGDCHSAMKFISRIVEREIIVRDANLFHHFKDGLCSCGDHW